MITDLDWAGMAIFRAAKENFLLLEPWRLGYQIMLQAYVDGNCHNDSEAGKSQQQVIDSSGSPWLDEQVIAILDKCCFVDQEIIGKK